MSTATPRDARSGAPPPRRLPFLLALAGLLAAPLAGVPFRQAGPRGGAAGGPAALPGLGEDGARDGDAEQDAPLLEARPARFRLSFERVEEAGVEDLGLVGLHYDLLAPFASLPGVYAGVGIYGGVDGTHGGLLTGGGTIGWRRELGRGFALDLGAYAGGGGDGESAAGLLLRPHAALDLPAGPLALRLELAHVQFAQGDVGGTTLALGATLPTELLLARRGPHGVAARTLGPGDLEERRLRIGPTVMAVSPDEGTTRRSLAPLDDEVLLGGLELDLFLTDWLHVPIQAYGAGGGGVSGYAMLLAGLGASPALLGERLRLEARALAGSGGGGSVDAGGGLLWQAEAGLSLALTHELAVQVLGGRLEAADGDFGGDLVRAGLTWTPGTLVRGDDVPREGLALAPAEVDVARLRVTAAHKTYFPHHEAELRGGDDLGTIQLLGSALEKPLVPGLAFSARGFGVVAGDAEGYAEALGGLLLEASPFGERHVLGLRGEIGAGGAGGLDVGSGLLYAASASWRWRLSRSLALHAELGLTEADRGSFAAEHAVLGLSWDLGLPVP